MLMAFGDEKCNIDKTLNITNENAQSFASGTVSVEFTEMQDKFLQNLIQEHIYSTLVAVQEGTQSIFWTMDIW